jgi:hypothetical protein
MTSRAERRRQVLLALDRTLVDQPALEREERAHLREHVGRHGRLDVARQAWPDAGVQRLLDRRHAVAHGELDRTSDGEPAAGVLDTPHLLIRGIGEMDIDVVRPHKPLVAQRHHIVGSDAAIAADHVGEDAQPELARQQPLLLVDAGAERERHQLVGRGEMLLLQPLRIARPLGVRAGAARIGVDRPNAGILEALDQGIAVLGRVGYLREIGDGGDAGIDRAQRTDQIADVGVLDPIMVGGRAGNVAEIIGQQPVGQHIAQGALVEVMMGVDEARQHDHVPGVDDSGVGSDVGSHRGDLRAFDQHVGLVEVADGAIEAQHHAALEQDAGRTALCKCGPPPNGAAGQERGAARQQDIAAAHHRPRASRRGRIIAPMILQMTARAIAHPASSRKVDLRSQQVVSMSKRKSYDKHASIGMAHMPVGKRALARRSAIG